MTTTPPHATPKDLEPTAAPDRRRASGHPGVGSPDTHTRLRDHQTSRVGTAFLRARARIVGGAALLFVVLLWAGPFPSAQTIALTGGLTLVVSAFSWEARAARHRDFTPHYIAASLLATTLVLGGMAVATGGLMSPMLPLMFAPVVTAFAAFGDTPVSRGSILTMVALLVAMAWVPEGFPFARIPQGYDAALHGSALLTGIALLYASVTGLTEGYREVGRSLDTMRRDVYEESRERARALEAVGAQVAHELKNPLASIKGLVQLEARGATEPKRQRRFDVLSEEIARMESILTDYLSFSRPLQEVRAEPLSPADLLATLDALLGPRALERDLVWAVEDRDTPTLEADPRQLRQALLNLCANALEACRPGDAVTLRARAARDAVAFEVEDTGPGMDAQTLELWGTPFETTRASGTGLGVVITRGIVQAHGGRLEVESEEGRGTTVRMLLPRVPGGGVE